MSHPRILGVLALCLTLSACDLFGGSGLGAPAPVTIPPYQLTTVDLSEALDIDESGSTYTLAAQSGSVQALIGFPDNLILTPRTVGAGTVGVVVSRDGAEEETVQFQIEVEDPGPLPAPAPVTLSQGETFAADLSTLFRPVAGTDFVLAGIQGGVSVSLDGAGLSVVANNVGPATVSVRTTKFVPQMLELAFTVVAE